jgi:hypothetical protein
MQREELERIKDIIDEIRRMREGTAGRLKNPARSTCPCTSTLRISHFPDLRTRRYNR